MSYITFDYGCTNCGVVERMVHRREMDEQYCDECGDRMRRLPAGPITTFKFADRAAIKSKKAVSLRDPNPGVTRKMTSNDV